MQIMQKCNNSHCHNGGQQVNLGGAPPFPNVEPPLLSVNFKLTRTAAASFDEQLSILPPSLHPLKNLQIYNNLMGRPVGGWGSGPRTPPLPPSTAPKTIWPLRNVLCPA